MDHWSSIKGVFVFVCLCVCVVLYVQLAFQDKGHGVIRKIDRKGLGLEWGCEWGEDKWNSGTDRGALTL